MGIIHFAYLNFLQAADFGAGGAGLQMRIDRKRNTGGLGQIAVAGGIDENRRLDRAAAVFVFMNNYAIGTFDELRAKRIYSGNPLDV